MRATTLSYYKELVLVTAVVYNLKCDKLVRITPFILFSKNIKSRSWFETC